MNNYISLLILSILLYILAILSMFVLLQNYPTKTQRNESGEKPKRSDENKLSTSPLDKLLDNVNLISKQIKETETTLDQLQFEIQDFGAINWNQIKELESKYYRLMDSLFLLVDYLENFSKQGNKSEEIEWIYQRTLRILHDENVSEIQVHLGDEFDVKYHRNVDNRASQMPDGTIIEIVRKGYYSQSSDGKEVILRHSDVVVSSGLKT